MTKKKNPETLSSEDLDQVTGGASADGTAKLSGDRAKPSAAVPFHHVINNTIYGGATQTGDGSDS